MKATKAKFKSIIKEEIEAALSGDPIEEIAYNLGLEELIRVLREMAKNGDLDTSKLKDYHDRFMSE